MSTTQTDPLPPWRQPDARGWFGPYGGKFVPETLMPALAELEDAYREAMLDRAFRDELDYLLRTYVGLPETIV